MQNCTRLIRVAASFALAGALLCAFGWGQDSNHVPNASAQKGTPGTFGYITVADQTGASLIAEYRMTNQGILGPLNPATVPAGVWVEGLSVLPGTNYLYALATSQYLNTPGTFTRFSIKSGRLKPNPIASPGPMVTPYPFALTPNGRFILVPAIDPGTVSSYSIGANGDLTLVSTVAAGE